MASALLTAAEIVAALAAGGWNLDQLIDHLKATGKPQHAATLETLKAQAQPAVQSDASTAFLGR
jgi:hypothetical protein